jgi:hypothetical protein
VEDLTQSIVNPAAIPHLERLAHLDSVFCVDTGLLMITLDGLDTDKKEATCEHKMLVFGYTQLPDCRVKMTKKELAVPKLRGRCVMNRTLLVDKADRNNRMAYSLLGIAQLQDMMGPEGRVMRRPERPRSLCGEELDSSCIPWPTIQRL